MLGIEENREWRAIEFSCIVFAIIIIIINTGARMLVNYNPLKITMIIIALLCLNACKANLSNEDLEKILQDGDIIFQTSQSSQSQAVQLVTKSKYSHMGIIFKEKNKLYVYEAVQPVKTTPLNEWIARGEKGHYVVKRLKNSDKVLTPQNKSKMQKIAKGFLGRPYDLTFEWSDQKLYCSEFIWKIYQRGAGIEIGKLEKLGDFDLSHPIVQQKIKERYGNTIPINEIVISPQSMYESPMLELIVKNQ